MIADATAYCLVCGHTETAALPPIAAALLRSHHLAFGCQSPFANGKPGFTLSAPLEDDGA